MESPPRLPLHGSLDLTYRCNNNCRHCWLWLPANAPQQKEELSEEEVEQVILSARALGCRDWAISGGEPMLRSDFTEIFEFISRHSRTYSLNTNGTLLTPRIAQLMRRPGQKMVALYGATAAIHDHITNVPGSFEALMRGFALLREAGTGFIVQIIPMRDNIHQYKQMLELAKTISPHYRIGAAWLNLSANGNRRKNTSITEQRLKPDEVILIDPPDYNILESQPIKCSPSENIGLLNACMQRSAFHIDPYGSISYCPYIKDTNQRYNLKDGTFFDAWERFLPSLKDYIKSDETYQSFCGNCSLRSDCHWCPAMARLETGSYTQPITYLCAIAREMRHSRQIYKQNNIRHYKIAGLSIRVQSDLAFKPHTFDPSINQFEVTEPNKNDIEIHHHFSLPPTDLDNLGSEIYSKPPWQIYKLSSGWMYLYNFHSREKVYEVAIFNKNYTKGNIYHCSSDLFEFGDISSLTLTSSDQVILAQVLANHRACYLHSSGAILNNNGMLFLGHSGAGKSTIANMIRSNAQLLCDDRNIIRRWSDGFYLHSTWNYGETIREVSNGEARLGAIFFIKQAKINRLTRIQDQKEIVHRLPFFVIKPLVTAEWWEKTLSLIEAVAQEVPCYHLEFDKSGEILDLLEKWSFQLENQKYDR